jgi:uncharacterized delta-60 repeat protein
MLSACNDPPTLRPDGPGANRLAFQGASGVSARLCSAALTLSGRDGDGKLLTLPTAATVALDGGGSGAFYTDATCSQRVSSVTLGPGAASMRLYFRDPVTETLTLQASVAGNTLGAGRHDFIVLAPGAAPGQLDPGFGFGGTTRTAISGAQDSPYALALAPDGRIYLAGAANNGTNFDFAIAAYAAAGTTDTTFGQAGKVIQPIGPGNEYITAAEVQPDGRLLVVGYGTGNSGNLDFALARYLPDGTLDPTFGNGGTTLMPIGTGDDRAFGLHLLPDGRFLVAGSSRQTDSTDPNNVVTTYFFTLVRYLPNGTLDPDFGNGGKVLTNVSTVDARASAVGVQSNGRIVLAGFAKTGGRYTFALTRYNSLGGLDDAFGTNGVLTLTPGPSTDAAFALAVQSDDKLVVGGYSDTQSQGRAFAVVRLLADGSLDPGFGTNGTALLLNPNSSGLSSAINALLVHPDGSIIAAGQTYDNTRETPALVRFTAAGVPDPLFGSGGLSLPNLDGVAYAIGLQTDGRVVFSAESRDDLTGNRDFTVGRIWP